MHECKRCTYEWESKVAGTIPRSCPKCKSYAWDLERVGQGRRLPEGHSYVRGPRIEYSGPPASERVIVYGEDAG